MSQTTEPHAPVTLVLGLGEIGKPLLQLLQQGGEHVIGVDVAPVVIAQPVTCMHVCYPFNVPDGFIPTTIAYATRYNPDVMVIHSTVGPGTTRAITAQSGKPCVYSPVRGKHVRMAQDLQHYTKFVAGDDASAVAFVQQHLQRAGMKTDVMHSSEALELAKLCETTYFGLLIAWAQDMQRMALAVQADYYDITKFFAEIPYLPPRTFVPGHIGGHCVMPNLAILKQYFQSDFLDAIAASNARVPAEGTNTLRHEPMPSR